MKGIFGGSKLDSTFHPLVGFSGTERVIASVEKEHVISHESNLVTLWYSSFTAVMCGGIFFVTTKAAVASYNIYTITAINKVIVSPP